MDDMSDCPTGTAATRQSPSQTSCLGPDGRVSTIAWCGMTEHCTYTDGAWECREGGYLWDADGDGYDPADCSYPCPACNTREYLVDAVEAAQCLTGFNGISTSGAETFRHRVEKALAVSPEIASAVLREIGPVACCDWDNPNAPDWNRTVTVIENAACD